MNTAELRNKIHTLVDTSDDEKLQTVYQLLQESEYTEEFKNILNEEFNDYQQNKNVISKEDMDELIKKALNKK